ncbi:hypothetical protein DY245_18600 [Streptomyces inhibens]|uniref:Uncharacterized protein n=1 Tax=Streptomyces inhibens TaxID=2293571 RepID=A0A371Q2I2_STRIH|nr:hypothetical protein DY245_18600 [Streptomyces inhibens]
MVREDRAVLLEDGGRGGADSTASPASPVKCTPRASVRAATVSRTARLMEAVTAYALDASVTGSADRSSKPA